MKSELKEAILIIIVGIIACIPLVAIIFELNKVIEKFEVTTEVMEAPAMEITNEDYVLNLLSLEDAYKPTIKISMSDDSWVDLLETRYGRSSDSFIGIVKSYSNAYDLDWQYVIAQIGVESNFKSNANSFLGASHGRGLMQVSDIVLQEYNKNHNFSMRLKVQDMYEPEYNIRVGTWYLNRLRKVYGFSDPSDIFLAYNVGPTALKNGTTTSYFKKICSLVDMRVIVVE